MIFFSHKASKKCVFFPLYIQITTPPPPVLYLWELLLNIGDKFKLHVSYFSILFSPLCFIEHHFISFFFGGGGARWMGVTLLLRDPLRSIGGSPPKQFVQLWCS